MRSWYDELGSGRGRLLGPPKLGSVGPNASQDHGDLAGYGDTRLLRSDAPREPRSPCLEGRPALHFREKDTGSLIKAGAGPPDVIRHAVWLYLRFTLNKLPGCRG